MKSRNINKLYKKMDKAIINNNFEKFIKLLPSISDVNCLYEGYTLLYLACKHNHVDFAKRMIQKGANVNFMINNTTPLSLAIKNGNIKLCKLLFKANVDIEIPSETGKTLFYTLFTNSDKDPNFEIFNLLVENNVKIFTDIQTYSEQMSTEWLKRLYQTYNDKIMPYLEALQQDMIDNDIDIVICQEWLNKSYITVQEAANLCDYDLLKKAVMLGGCVNGSNNINAAFGSELYDRPLNISVAPLLYQTDNELKMFKYLLKKGADPTLRDMVGLNAFEATVKYNEFEMFKILLDEYNFDVNEPANEKEGFVWLYIDPTKLEYVKFVSAIIDKNPNIDFRDGLLMSVVKKMLSLMCEKEMQHTNEYKNIKAWDQFVNWMNSDDSDTCNHSNGMFYDDSEERDLEQQRIAEYIDNMQFQDDPFGFTM